MTACDSVLCRVGWPPEFGHVVSVRYVSMESLPCLGAPGWSTMAMSGNECSFWEGERLRLKNDPIGVDLVYGSSEIMGISGLRCRATSPIIKRSI